jgi:subtilase family protein
MTTSDEGNGRSEPRPRWSDSIAVSEVGDGFAYVPGVILVRGAEAEERATVLTDGTIERREDPLHREDIAIWQRVVGLRHDVDVLTVVEVLRSEGLEAQPEHVFFAHGCTACELGPHPSLLAEIASGAVGANPYRANPYRANPYRANPYRANPYRANPYRANEAPTSTAEPATGRSLPPRPDLQGPGQNLQHRPRVVVLDTGLAGIDAGGQQQLPGLLNAGRISGTTDLADDTITLLDGSAFPPDGYLDPVAGHGTFIAGLVEQLAPGCEIRIERKIRPLGDARELDIVDAIETEAAVPDQSRADILSMSFGGTVFEHAPALRMAIAAARLAGIVLVASAGNDGVCVPQYPAAYDEVVGVGCVGPDGPAPWTNYGDWVDACAPGVELVSAFFASFNGKFPMMNTVDIDAFYEWATWSGSSFSGPVVVAALAREMVVGDCIAADAVQRVVRAPHLMRFPCLGTVVNL